ncbi:MAG: DUF4124 domain-containing protein [Myxococcota bacterium]|nr:DUF4124 domain-containing protein [Myxococcota bacterium]
MLLLASLLLFAFGAPARAGEVYSWRTADGGTAFTDDPKSIPARYRGQAEVRHTAQLGTYERFSGQDAVSAKRYEQGLAKRLERLRAFNASGSGSDAAGGRNHRMPEALSLRNGEGDGIELSVPAGSGVASEPVVVETVKMRLRGSSVIQDAEVVRRGTEVLAVRKPRPRQWNLSDPVDEGDVAEGLRSE